MTIAELSQPGKRLLRHLGLFHLDLITEYAVIVAQ